MQSWSIQRLFAVVAPPPGRIICLPGSEACHVCTHQMYHFSFCVIHFRVISPTEMLQINMALNRAPTRILSEATPKPQPASACLPIMQPPIESISKLQRILALGRTGKMVHAATQQPIFPIMHAACEVGVAFLVIRSLGELARCNIG